MVSRMTINIIRRAIHSTARTFYCAQSVLKSNLLVYNSTKQHSVQKQCDFYVGKRFKSNKKKSVDKEDSDEDTDDEVNDEAPVGSTIITRSVQSLRMDAVYKVAFGLSRNKIEEAFYASLFRVNGKKVKKKSIEVEEGDEIDMVLYRDLNNPALLHVNRVVVLSIKPGTNDTIQIKISKDKNLLIEDYEDSFMSS